MRKSSGLPKDHHNCIYLVHNIGYIDKLSEVIASYFCGSHITINIESEVVNCDYQCRTLEFIAEPDMINMTKDRFIRFMEKIDGAERILTDVATKTLANDKTIFHRLVNDHDYKWFGGCTDVIIETYDHLDISDKSKLSAASDGHVLIHKNDYNPFCMDNTEFTKKLHAILDEVFNTAKAKYADVKDAYVYLYYTDDGRFGLWFDDKKDTFRRTVRIGNLHRFKMEKLYRFTEWVNNLTTGFTIEIHGGRNNDTDILEPALIKYRIGNHNYRYGISLDAFYCAVSAIFNIKLDTAIEEQINEHVLVIKSGNYKDED